MTPQELKEFRKDVAVTNLVLFVVLMSVMLAYMIYIAVGLGSYGYPAFANRNNCSVATWTNMTKSVQIYSAQLFNPKGNLTIYIYQRCSLYTREVIDQGKVGGLP